MQFTSKLSCLFSSIFLFNFISDFSKAIYDHHGRNNKNKRKIKLHMWQSNIGIILPLRVYQGSRVNSIGQYLLFVIAHSMLFHMCCKIKFHCNRYQKLSYCWSCCCESIFYLERVGNKNKLFIHFLCSTSLKFLYKKVVF